MRSATSNDRARRAIDDFFFSPASARPIAAIRVGLAAVLLVQAIALRAEILPFLAHDGLVQDSIAAVFRAPGAPTIAAIARRLAPIGIGEAATIHAVCGAYLVSLGFLAVGLFTRIAAVAAWMLHWTLISTASTTCYGVDLYAHVFLFYLMWAPAGRAWSIDVALGRTSSSPTPGARFALRVLQAQLCLTYLASGIEKATGPEWWSGEVIWRAISLPVYRQFDMAWLAHAPWLAQLASVSALVIEIGYSIFIWPRATRPIWIAAVVGLHLGIAVMLGLGLFGAEMCALTIALFGVSADPAARALDQSGWWRMRWVGSTK